MDNLAEKRGVQILMDIAQVVTDSLVADGLDAGKAREIGLAAADLVRQSYGGEQLYVPKGLALIIGPRDREIYGKFNGANCFALSKEYGVTERQIYNIIARIRAEEFRSKQCSLFAD
jgi:Mor family transcriptional regulator